MPSTATHSKLSVVLCQGPGVFRVPRATLLQLFEDAPHLFEEPMPVEALLYEHDRPLEDQYDWAVVRDDQAHFLALESPALRTFPGLVEEVRRQHDRLARLDPNVSSTDDDRAWRRLKVVEVHDDGLPWSVWVADDGGETIVHVKTSTIVSRAA